MVEGKLVFELLCLSASPLVSEGPRSPGFRAMLSKSEYRTAHSEAFGMYSVLDLQEEPEDV